MENPLTTDESSNVEAKGHEEGYVARAIEKQTVKVPSDVFLWSALGSIIASLSFKVAGKDRAALFVGQWAPTILVLGLYNKLVKISGSNGQEKSES